MMKYLVAALLLFAAPAAAQPIVTTQTGTLIPNESNWVTFYPTPPSYLPGTFYVTWSFNQPFTGTFEVGTTTGVFYYDHFTGQFQYGDTSPGWNTVNIGNKGAYHFVLPGSSRTFDGFQYDEVITHSLDYFRFDGETGTAPMDYTVKIYFAAAVPEASTWTMMILAAGISGAVLRRRRDIRHRQAIA